MKRMTSLGRNLACGLALLAGACSTGGTVDTGPVVVGGSLFGSAFSSSAVPQSEADVVLADLLRTDAGKDLSTGDRRAAATALRDALAADRTGTTVRWENRSSGSQGRVVTGPAYQVNNIVCRDYTHVIEAGNGERSMRGSACRSAEGAWQPIV
ncbi:MAG: lipoprotein LipA [Stappia sp.]|uniref:RT0821/Lpp0805 family surface protein n=1 Tax=Stappia sp. TaxID=1870903 RepID=UPI000C8C1404|nr:lipoprotein LipA [Stappia sp.]